MGGIFRVRVTEVSETEALSLATGTRSVVLDMGGRDLTKDGLPAPVTLIAGSEAHGVREALKAAAAEVCSLPMKNQTESLNVAVAAAVAMYFVR